MSDLKAVAAPPTPADAAPRSWVNATPAVVRPYLQLSRFDRPAGFWLLALPCFIGLALSRTAGGFLADDLALMVEFGLGAVAMRGAGCTYNDLLDAKIDALVARTASRPLPSGTLRRSQAVVWLALQVLVGFGVLLTLSRPAQLVALGSLPMVALYPMMKRITWWPQVWLGLTFNWGVLVASAATRGHISLAHGVLYAGVIFWTLGYDTIYALQDREDDALIGVKSTARRFGGKVRPAIGAIYGCTAGLIGAAGYLAAGWPGLAAIVPFGLHLAQQALRLDPADPELALALFQSNRDAGILLFAGWAFIAAFI